MNLIAKWKEIVDKLNTKGIPLPMMRDPKTKKGSVTFSLLITSASLCLISILIMLGTAVAKLSHLLILNADTANQIHDAFISSLQFFVTCFAGYLGRKMQRDPNGGISLDGSIIPENLDVPKTGK